jgi:signal transduction histidine kinase
LSRPEIENLIPVYLRALSDAGDELGMFTGKRRELVESHLASRLRQGFQLASIIEEFALVGRCIASVWSSGQADPPGHAEIERLFEELQLASAAVTEMFTQHMLEDEQAEKRYLRLVQAVAREAMQPEAKALRGRLEEVLELIREAVGAQSTALLLVNALTSNLEMVASVGAAKEELEYYVSSVDLSSFAGQVASREQATTIWDAAATDLKISETLRRSGVHSLLGVRLPARHTLVGVLYVGLAETRTFTAREVRRLEVLGEQLTLHLENAKLYADLSERIARLHAERDMRDLFVSVLVHDLRGPLTAATMSAQLLLRQDPRDAAAARILRSVERADRMIQDLLDANRVHAGERLPLRIEACDLSALVRAVYDDAVETFGERFRVEAAPSLVGFWSADELRRALWNLTTNAVKYGSPTDPITMRVERTARGARIAIHNWGNPISGHDQGLLFKPFSRTRAAESGGQRGWGLGLTLVGGCARAHGGRIGVESTQEEGTTFWIELPLDSRPFQPTPPAPMTAEAAPPSSIEGQAVNSVRGVSPRD